MVTMAVEPFFVDTNVLVYSAISTAPFHAVAVRTLESLRQASVELWLSRQILREYLATLSRPQTYVSPLPTSVIVADVIHFQASFRVAEDGPSVTTNLLNLLTTVPTGGKQIHDANIVATMLTYSIPRLLTQNTADFARFASVITVVPLTP